MGKPNFAVVECEHPKGLGTYHVAFSPDGRSVTGFLTEVGDHLGIACWDADSGKLLERFPASVKGQQHAKMVAASDDRRWLAVPQGETVRIYDGSTLKPQPALRTSYVNALGWSPDGQCLASVTHHEVKCWTVPDGRLLATLRVRKAQENDDIKFVGFLKDGPEIVLGRDSGIVSWNFKGKLTARVKFSPHDGWFWQHGLSPQRDLMLSLSDRGVLLQTDTKTWKTKRFNAVKNSHGQNLSFTPDGKLAVTATGNATVIIWDVVKGAPWLKWKKPHFGNLGSIALSPDGQRLACTLDFQLFILDFRPDAKTVTSATPVMVTGMLQCVEMVGGDDRMDQQGGNRAPLNALPAKCGTCRMPDLDLVAEPYQLGRGLASPIDLAPAEAGNFLVREPARRVLETVAPGQCRFVPTVHQKTREVTPWFLAVPTRLETTATPPKNRERCPQCGEPWCFHHYSESTEAWQSPVAPHDVFKSRNWGCHKEKFKGWDKLRPAIFGRMLYFSVRLETLFKKLKLRGLVRCYACKELPSATDLAWVEQKLRLLSGAKPPAAKAGQTGDKPGSWFAEYLTKHAPKRKMAAPDFAAVERRQKVRLPETYREFISQVGPTTFKDIDGEEGFHASILPPAKLGFDEFRRPAAEENDDDDGGIDGVVFATTDHGDVFCFDLGRKNADYPVFKHNHETGEFEPYAENFAACIRQFAGQ